MTDTPNPSPVGDLAVQLRRLSKLLASTVERLEAVEGLQAVTVDEQNRVVEELERQTERLRLVVERRTNYRPPSPTPRDGSGWPTS